MKFSRLLLILLILAPLALRADDSDDSDDQQNKPPPEEIPDFSHLDEYVYVPRNTLNFGFRFASGVRASFSGNGMIAAPEVLPDPNAPDILRTYHDGSVGVDTRAVTVDNGDGTTGEEPLPSDGKTNTWSDTSSSQLTADDYMQFNIYSAQTEDPDIHNNTGPVDLGWELFTARDWITLNKHMSLKLFVGFSINDIQDKSDNPNMNATVTTLTDTYDLFGQVPPAAPYTAPSSTTQNVVDSNGNQVNNSQGNPETQTVDTTTLLGDAPINRTITNSAAVGDEVENRYEVHGGFATFRGGPQFVYKFNDHFHLETSVGPALIYAGSAYTISEIFTPPTGDQIIDTLNDVTSKLVLGYYADVTMEYDLTDRSGLYFGAFFQDAGSYTQTASNYGSSQYGSLLGNADYAVRVNFGDQEGIRSGLSFRF